MPPSISAPSAASVSRSTVRHHSLNKVGCAREAMAKRSPSANFPTQSCIGHGFQAIKIAAGLAIATERACLFLL
jgi:hypothetical protein